MNDTTRRFAVALALAFTLAPLCAQQPQPLNPPLKNWAAPLYWAPTPGEAEQQRIEQRIAHPEASSSAIAQAASIFTAPGPMTFIAMTPCRVMDTRSSQPFTGAFGPPSLAAYGTYRQVPMPTSSCNIPANAGAYSLNITVVPPGPLSFLSVWPAGQPYPVVSTLNDPVSGGVIANAAIVVAGTAGAIQMVAGNPTDVIIDINGYYAAPSDALGNTGIGTGALLGNSGSSNTATGGDALYGNSGTDNTAVGFSAIGSGPSSGNANTAIGVFALQANTTGSNNTASGTDALNLNTTGSNNTASGAGALQNNTIGIQNTASGAGALQNNTTGNYNIAIGYYAASSVSNGNSKNIHIGSEGASSDNGVIKIGTEGDQTTANIAGIYGTVISGGTAVSVNSNGLLGTTASSRRFKEQITDMGDSSSRLFQLRPVNFFYKPQYDDGSHLLQYGLIAEEVAEVYPEMVAYDRDGQIMTVKYQLLAPMLLNEVQKQNAAIQSQQEENRKMEEQNRKLEDRLAALEALLSGRAPTAAKTGGSQ